MLPHGSDTTLAAHARYAADVLKTFEWLLDGGPIRDGYLIMQVGMLVDVGTHSYPEGSPTAWSRRRGATSPREFG